MERSWGMPREVSSQGRWALFRTWYWKRSRTVTRDHQCRDALVSSSRQGAESSLWLSKGPFFTSWHSVAGAEVPKYTSCSARARTHVWIIANICTDAFHMGETSWNPPLLERRGAMESNKAWCFSFPPPCASHSHQKECSTSKLGSAFPCRL